MAEHSIDWPVKTRELHNHHFDSTVWNDLTLRDDDIVIATYAKSGTTWTQQIIGQLLFNGSPDVSVGALSPWVDLRAPPKAVKLEALDAQTHRRFLKTHLPIDALRFSPRVKYIYIGRDGRDMLWSMYNHHANANADFYALINDTPGRVGPPLDKPVDSVVDYFRTWLARDGYPFWPYWDSIKGWWAYRHLPNILFLHFADMKADMAHEIRRIAAFLDLPIDPKLWPAILEHCSFDYMKAHAANAAPLGGALWDGGGETFINKGENGRWRDMLTAEDNAAYESKALAELGALCANWLSKGGPID